MEASSNKLDVLGKSKKSTSENVAAAATTYSESAAYANSHFSPPVRRSEDFVDIVSSPNSI